MNSPQITIVTPTYDRRGSLMRAVKSVLDQTFVDFEYIVVDDCSSDGTADAMHALEDPRVRYIRFSNRQGANAARNAGIENSNSPIVTFLDSDDEYMPDRVEYTLSHFLPKPSLSLMISSHVSFGSRRSRRSVRRDVFVDASPLERAIVIEAINTGSSAITVRRSHLLAAGLFDTKIRRFQDRDLLLRLSQLGGAFLSAKSDWVKHLSSDSISHKRPGYVQSYGDFVHTHREAIQRNFEAAPYLVARRILNNTLQGRPLQALRDFRENQNHAALGYGITELARSYINGRRLRTAIRDELR